MTVASLNIYGSTFKAVGVSLIGGGVVTVPANAPAWITATVICAGVLLQIAGIVCTHLADAKQQQAVAIGAAIDRGENVAPVPASVIPTPIPK